MTAEWRAQTIVQIGDGVKKSDQRAAQESRCQQGEEQIVFEGLPWFVAVGGYALPAQFSFRPDVTNQVMQCPERANPATEKSSQKHRRDDDRQAPEQPAIERVRGQRIGDGDQRVGFQKVVAISGKTKKDQEES